MSNRLLLVILALLPVTGYAACSVAVKNSAQASLNGTPIRGANTLEPCTGELLVTHGEASVCTTKGTDDAQCRTVKPGEPINLARLNARGNNTAVAMLGNIYNTLRGIETSTGGRRAFDVGPLHGLPNELVALPEGDLVIEPNLGVTGAIKQFSLFEKGKPTPVFTATKVSDAIVIPAKLLRPGAAFTWQVTSARLGALTDDFNLTDTDLTARLRNDLRAARAQGDGPMSSLLIEAMVYGDYEMTWDRDRAFNRALN